MSARLGGVKFAPVETPEEASDAGVIVTITSSRQPVLQGAWLKPGTHINAAGGTVPAVCAQLCDDAVARLRERYDLVIEIEPEEL